MFSEADVARVKDEIRRRLLRLVEIERHKFNPPANTGWLSIDRNYVEKTAEGEGFLAVETIRLTYDWETRLRIAHFKNGVRLSDICLIHLRDYREPEHWCLDAAFDVAIPMLRRYMILDDLADV